MTARTRLSPTLLLGLDVGSSLVKAVVFDRRGRVIASAERVVAVRRPGPGWVERDAESTWLVTAAVLRRVVRGRATRIAAVGVTGCGNGAIFLDRRLRPLRAGILSSDTRAAAFLPPRERQTGQEPYPGQLPVLLAWLRRCERGAARRLHHVLFWKDFIRLRLTGQLGTDFTDAGAAGLLAHPARRYRTPEPVLPPLRASLAPGGTVTPAAARISGLPAGTPVMVGCLDCEAAALGSGVYAPGQVSVIAGTWSINQAYARRLPRSHRHFLVNPAVTPGRWLVLEGGPTSAANFDWARRTLAPGLTPARAVAEAARPVRSVPLFFPRVPAGHGVFAGLDASHGRGAMLRAVLQGVVFTHRAYLECLAASVGRVRRVVLTGGAARSPFWCQLFADGLGVPVEVPRHEQSGALGAALCAGIGAGFWSTIPSAQRALGGPRRSYRPDPIRRTALAREYAAFRRHPLFLTP